MGSGNWDSYLILYRLTSLTRDPNRKIGASKEQARREQMAEDMANGGYGATQDDDDEMEF